MYRVLRFKLGCSAEVTHSSKDNYWKKFFVTEKNGDGWLSTIVNSWGNLKGVVLRVIKVYLMQSKIFSERKIFFHVNSRIDWNFKQWRNAMLIKECKHVQNPSKYWGLGWDHNPLLCRKSRINSLTGRTFHPQKRSVPFCEVIDGLAPQCFWYHSKPPLARPRDSHSKSLFQPLPMADTMDLDEVVGFCSVITRMTVELTSYKGITTEINRFSHSDSASLFSCMYTQERCSEKTFPEFP